MELRLERPQFGRVGPQLGGAGRPLGLLSSFLVAFLLSGRALQDAPKFVELAPVRSELPLLDLQVLGQLCDLLRRSIETDVSDRGVDLPQLTGVGSQSVSPESLLEPVLLGLEPLRLLSGGSHDLGKLA